MTALRPLIFTLSSSLLMGGILVGTQSLVSPAAADYSPVIVTHRADVASTMGPWQTPDYTIADTDPAPVPASVDITKVTVSQGLMTENDQSLGEDPYVTVKTRLGDTSTFPSTAGNTLAAQFSWDETTRTPVTHDEEQCHKETQQVRKTKRFQGRAAILRAVKHGWKRVPGAQVTAEGTLMFRFVKETHKVCEIVQVTEIVTTITNRKILFTGKVQAGGGVEQSVTDEKGNPVACDSSWWSGLVGADQDLYGVDVYAYYPTSCIPTKTFTVTMLTPSDSAATPEPVTVVSPETLRTVHGLFQHSISATDNPDPVLWSGSSTDSAVYDPTDQMLVLTQKFRGRAPVFTPGFKGKFGWFLAPDASVPGFDNAGGWRGLNATMGADGQWEISVNPPPFSMIFGEDAANAIILYRNWSTCATNTADFTYTDGVATFRLPVECLSPDPTNTTPGAGPVGVRVATYNTPPSGSMDPWRTYTRPGEYSPPVFLR